MAGEHNSNANTENLVKLPIVHCANFASLLVARDACYVCENKMPEIPIDIKRCANTFSHFISCTPIAKRRNVRQTPIGGNAIFQDSSVWFRIRFGVLGVSIG